MILSKEQFDALLSGTEHDESGSGEQDPNSMFRFNEGKYIEEITQYVRDTYGQHYAKSPAKIQALDGLEACGIVEEYCRGSAMTYLWRLGNKEGYNRKDLLKTAHYIILMLHYMDKKNEVNS
jgi:hypothetical protein